eukprot:6998015-Prymnesium_polylepis.1
MPAPRTLPARHAVAKPHPVLLADHPEPVARLRFPALVHPQSPCRRETGPVTGSGPVTPLGPL